MERIGLSRGVVRDIVESLRDDTDLEQHLPAVVYLEVDELSSNNIR